MVRCYGILLLLLCTYYTHAQNAFLIPVKKQPVLLPIQVPARPVFTSLNSYTPQSLQPVANNLYTQRLPFFCKQELKMEQAHVPLKIRVGSIEDCNWLERKPGYTYRP